MPGRTFPANVTAPFRRSRAGAERWFSSRSRAVVRHPLDSITHGARSTFVSHSTNSPRPRYHECCMWEIAATLVSADVWPMGLPPWCTVFP